MTRDPPLCALTRIFEGTDDAGTTDHTLNEPSTFPDTCIALLALFIINHSLLLLKLLCEAPEELE